MDVILNGSLVNGVLGVIYAFTGFQIGRLVWNVLRASPEQYAIIASRKTYFLSVMFAILATCATVSYQNFFNDFNEGILWWRVALITFIGYSMRRWSRFAESIKELTEDIVNHNGTQLR